MCEGQSEKKSLSFFADIATWLNSETPCVLSL